MDMALDSGLESVSSWSGNTKRLRDIYDPAQEHDSCGVGVVVALDGKPSRAVVQGGIDALKAVWHRGAIDADGKTSDGAGIHLEIPYPSFADAIRCLGKDPGAGRIAVGQVFLPKTDLSARDSRDAAAAMHRYVINKARPALATPMAAE